MAGKPFPYNVPAGGRYGAPMGRHNIGVAPCERRVVTLRRVPLPDGYDGGGAYWGIRERGEMLFCAWTADRSFVRYLDARSYLFAQETIREEFPEVEFAGGH